MRVISLDNLYLAMGLYGIIPLISTHIITNIFYKVVPY